MYVSGNWAPRAYTIVFYYTVFVLHCTALHCTVIVLYYICIALLDLRVASGSGASPILQDNKA